MPRRCAQLEPPEHNSCKYLNRLAHDAHVITITGDSYRTRSTRRRVAEKAALEPETAAA